MLRGANTADPCPARFLTFTLFEAFQDPQKTKQVVKDLREFSVIEINEPDNNADMKRVAKAMKNLIEVAPKSEFFKMEEIGEHPMETEVEHLRWCDLVPSPIFSSLRHLELHTLDVDIPRQMIYFFHKQAATLIRVDLYYIEVTENLKWTAVLDSLRKLKWPALQLFTLHWCRGL